MREFDMDLTSFLKNGMPPKENMHVRTEGLSSCTNLLVMPYGVVGRPSISDLTGDTLTEILSVDDVIDVLDFHTFIVAITSSGVEELVLNENTGIYSNITPATPSYPEFTAGCAYDQSQAVCGYGRDVYWSKIGRFDFTVDSSNEAGHAPLPFSGDVLNMKQLGKFVIVLGSHGVCAMAPVSDPVPAWQIIRFPQLNNIGMFARNAVTVLEDGLVFVAGDYNIYKIDAQLKITQLGYRHKMRDMHDVFVLSYVPQYNAAYITNGILCYALTSQGLSQVDHFAPSIIPLTGDVDNLMAGYVIENADKDNFSLSTQPIDFGMRAAKHIQALEFAVETPVLAECSISWRNTVGAWRDTSWFRLNPQGYVQIPCSGVEFKINLRGVLDDSFHIAGLMAKIKYEDKRSLRGQYAR